MACSIAGPLAAAPALRRWLRRRCLVEEGGGSVAMSFWLKQFWLKPFALVGLARRRARYHGGLGGGHRCHPRRAGHLDDVAQAAPPTRGGGCCVAAAWRCGRVRSRRRQWARHGGLPDLAGGGPCHGRTRCRPPRPHASPQALAWLRASGDSGRKLASRVGALSKGRNILRFSIAFEATGVGGRPRVQGTSRTTDSPFKTKTGGDWLQLLG